MTEYPIFLNCSFSAELQQMENLFWKIIISQIGYSPTFSKSPARFESLPKILGKHFGLWSKYIFNIWLYISLREKKTKWFNGATSLTFRVIAQLLTRLGGTDNEEVSEIYCLYDTNYILTVCINMLQASMDFSFYDQPYILDIFAWQTGHQSLCKAFFNLSTVPSISAAFQTNAI